MRGERAGEIHALQDAERQVGSQRIAVGEELERVEDGERRLLSAAFALSATYAGVAGGLLSVVVGFIDPVEFGISASLRQITFIVVGGLGSVAGSVIGAAVLSALPEVLRPVKEYSDIIYTMILLGFLLFVPRGLVTIWTGLLRMLPRASVAAVTEARAK